MATDSPQMLVQHHPLQRWASPSRGLSALVHVRIPMVGLRPDIGTDATRTTAGRALQFPLVVQLVCAIPSMLANDADFLARMHENPNQA